MCAKNALPTPPPHFQICVPQLRKGTQTQNPTATLNDGYINFHLNHILMALTITSHSGKSFGISIVREDGKKSL